MNSSSDSFEVNEGLRQDFTTRERREHYLAQIAGLLNVSIEAVVNGTATKVPVEQTADLMRHWHAMDGAGRLCLLQKARTIVDAVDRESEA